MAEMVSQSIVDNRNADVSWFSILEDDAHDNNDTENAIKLICNRVIHESEIVCRVMNKKHSLKHRLDLSISIEKTYGFKSMDDSITN
jgi:hypothetical protein